jgi:hypothetical protein
MGPTHRPLDYALLRVNRAEQPDLDLTVARLARAAPPGPGDLAVPQYPGNYPYAINYDKNCRDFGPVQSHGGETYVFSPHGCDTAGGSSGSPVFTRDMSEVVGVHACCSLVGDAARMVEPGEPARPADDKAVVAADPGEVNQYVPMQLILCDIKARDPDLFREIAASQGWTESGGDDALLCDGGGA